MQNTHSITITITILLDLAIPDGFWPPQLNFPPDHSWKPVKPTEQLKPAKTETIETSETIKTIEWWTGRAYLRRQTKEVEIINRCPPIIPNLHQNQNPNFGKSKRAQ